MIKPTIGRRVWFYPNGTTGIPVNHDQPCEAVVCYVWSDRMVNLTVAGHDGSMHARTSVLLLQDDDQPPPSGPYATWMPYQVGQAKQVEAGKAEPSKTAPTKSIDPLDRLASMAKTLSGLSIQLKALGQEMEVVALEVEERAQQNATENAKLRQLKELLREI